MELEINRSVLELCCGDITHLKVDAIVNAANSRLAGGGGVDGAIHSAGGPAIMKECRKFSGCPTGEAIITTGGNLLANHVIHTVGPIYRDGKSGEPELLTKAYQNSLKIAEKAGIKTMAFPSISTGIYGYPINEAAKIALSSVTEYLEEETIIEKTVFVLFSQKDFNVYSKTLKGLKLET